MKRYAMFVIPAVGLVLVIGGFLVANLNDTLVYYRTPTEVIEGRQPDLENRFRLGGQVVPGSVAEGSGTVRFLVTDGGYDIPVVHTGTPKELFREGVGVVLEGVWDGEAFHSDEMIVKHDEQYRTDDGAVYTPPHADQVETGG